MSRRRYFVIAAFLCCFCVPCWARQEAFLRTPSISASQIAFSFENQLWIVPREGGVARQLTTGQGTKAEPFISPDGKWIAYTGRYRGASNIYLISISGGVPRRLTFSTSGTDEVVGWSPDSSRILFRSSERSPFLFPRLFTISLQGGPPEELPFPQGVMGAFSPDGQRIAYVPVWNAAPDLAWKHYRGGKQARIWIARLSDSSIEPLSRENSNDFNPMWLGDKIYFLSDRSGPVTLFVFDLKTKQVKEVLPPDNEDIQWASATSGVILYEQLGRLRICDLETTRISDVKVQITSDFPNLQPRNIKVGDEIASYNISPTGVRGLFEAHGDIFTVPTARGEVRNLTQTPGVAERDPAWSPDGRWIAYFSDESGEYSLHLRSQDGARLHKINLGQPPSFYYSPQWSPDSKRICYTDARLNLWYVDISEGTPVKVATDYYVSPFRNFDVAWSPDSRWIAYTMQLPSHIHALFLYSLAARQTSQVSDGMSDIRYLVFDSGGKYLYFTAATDVAQTLGWLDLSSYGQSTSRSVYLIMLRKNLPNPFPIENDEEQVAPEVAELPKAPLPSGAPAKPSAPAIVEPPKTTEQVANESKAAPLFSIDLNDISKRIIPLPFLARNYTQLQGGTAGMLYLAEAPVGSDMLPNRGSQNVYRYEMDSSRFSKLLEGVSSFQVSFDGKKAIYASRAGGTKRWSIARLPGPLPSAGDALPLLRGELLKTDQMELLRDLRAEWKQIYHEAWRIERDFYYDSRLHGLRWEAMEKTYESYLDLLSCREDLNYLLIDIFGQLGTSHVTVSMPQEEDLSSLPATGFLGADFSIENGYYRIQKIYGRPAWRPDLRSPLTEPGVNVHEGDYVFAVNGRELRATDSIAEFLYGTVGKSVTLEVSSDYRKSEARIVTVVPIWSEMPLREQAWVEGNRRLVDKLSRGQIGYIPVPDTRAPGFKSLNQYFFAQLDKQALIIDGRYNRGGFAPDYIIDMLQKSFLNYWFTREGHSFTTPVGANPGPKALVVNMFAGSGGDALAWYFRLAKIGPIVGTRTWGGIAGTYEYPELIDGSQVSPSQLAPYSLDGKWVLENEGVEPDVNVELLPKEWREGHDPQLERAIELLLKKLSNSPLHPPQPPSPSPARNK